MLKITVSQVLSSTLTKTNFELELYNCTATAAGVTALLQS